MVSNSLVVLPLSAEGKRQRLLKFHYIDCIYYIIAVILYNIMYSLCVNMIMTFKHTYSSIRSFTLLNMRVTCVIFSTITPTSCRSWSIVMGLPIMEDRQFCNMHRLWDTCRQSGFNMKYIGNLVCRHNARKLYRTPLNVQYPYLLVELGILVSVTVHVGGVPYLLGPVYRLVRRGGQH